jgi:dTDP-glucose 4,6-dehydratase
VTETWLITGGAGFIGVNLVRQLLAEAPHTTVVNLDKLTYAGNLASLDDVLRHPRHHFVLGDVCDPSLLKDLLRTHRPTAVLHLAAESHVDRSIDGPAAFVQTNVFGTCTLLDACLEYWRELDNAARETFRLLNVSTDEVYGALGASGAFTETTPYHPSSPYSASKASADHFVRAYQRTYGLPTIITSCSNNFGPYQFPEKLIPLVIHNALRELPLPVYGDGQQVRDWLFVEDHCRALRMAIERGTPGETYLIGGRNEKTNLQIVQAIWAILDELRPRAGGSYGDLITFVADRPGHDRRYTIDCTKIETEWNWRPNSDFNTNLRGTVRWYLDHQDWIERVTEGKCAGERLGLLPQAVPPQQRDK